MGIILCPVFQVPSNSSAAKAGLKPTARGLAGNIVLGDIIIAVEGKPVSKLLLVEQYLFHSIYPKFSKC